MDLWLIVLVAILVAVIGMVVFLSKKQPIPAKVPVQIQTNPQLEGAYAVKRNDQNAKQRYERAQLEIEAAEELTPNLDDQLQTMNATLQQLKVKQFQQPTTIQASNQADSKMLLQQVQQMSRQAKQQQKQMYKQLQQMSKQASQLLQTIDESVQSMETLTTLTEQLEQTEQQLQQGSN